MKHIKLFKIFESSENLTSFVEKESYFTLDDEDMESVTFITRENGDVGSETPGQSDVKEAKRLKDVIKNTFGYNSEIELVDEWVYLKVILKSEEKKERYTIFKHIGSLSEPGWRGFGESSKTIEDLEAKIIHWTDIESKEAAEYVKQLLDKTYNQKDFSSQYAEIKLPSKSMGYDWTIRKSKKRF